MKKLFYLFIVTLLLAGTVGAQQPDIFSAARDRVVFIDLERVFNGFYKTQLAKSKVDVQTKDIEVEKQVMVDEMTTVDEEADVLKKEARDATLTEEIRDSKRILYEESLLELREKQKEIEDFSSRRQQQLQLQVTRMSQKIMDEIRQTVIEYAKAQGLMAVIDSSSRRAAIGVFIYTHPDVDITETVLSVLNSKRPDVLDGGDLFEDDVEEEDSSKESSEES